MLSMACEERHCHGRPRSRIDFENSSIDGIRTSKTLGLKTASNKGNVTIKDAYCAASRVSIEHTIRENDSIGNFFVIVKTNDSRYCYVYIVLMVANIIYPSNITILSEAVNACHIGCVVNNVAEINLSRSAVIV